MYRAVTVLSCANFDSQKTPEHARLLQDLCFNHITFVFIIISTFCCFNYCLFVEVVGGFNEGVPQLTRHGCGGLSSKKRFGIAAVEEGSLLL